jgi:hypothetical protein
MKTGPNRREKWEDYAAVEPAALVHEALIPAGRFREQRAEICRFKDS